MNRMTSALIALSCLLTFPVAFAQTYTGNLSLESQTAVDSFSYTEVTGSLTISGADIVDLSPLSALVSIGKYLSISDNSALVVVDGFENLTSVGWGIQVWNNSNLVSFSGFEALVLTGDNIDFWYNDSLVDVSGFSALQTAGWSLEFGGNPLLTDIPDFDSLQTIESSLFILDNPSLTAITGFGSLSYVDWSFQVIGNSSLNNLSGFFNNFSDNNPYSGSGSFDIETNHSDLPNPTTIQDVLDAGPCPDLSIDQPSPTVLIDQLNSDIQAMELAKGATKSLVRTLDKARNYLQDGNNSAATSQLVGMIDDILALERRRKIDSATADHLAGKVLECIDAI